MNVRARLVLLLMAVVVLSIIGISVGVLSGVQNLPRDNVDAYLERIADENRDQEVSRRDVRELIGVSAPGDANQEDNFAQTNRLQYLQAGGDIATASGRRQLPTDDLDFEIARDGGETRLRSVVINDVNYRVVTFPVLGIDLNDNDKIDQNERRGAIQVGRDVDDASKLVEGIVPRVTIFGTLGAVLAGLIGWGIASRVTGPITALAETAERVARTQDLAERIPVERTDEVGRLATSFNTMLAALETSRQQQHQLVMDANHELRTPLTSLRTNIEVLQRNRDALTASDQEQLLADVTSELDELTSLVSELVDSATSIDQSSEPHQEVELVELVEAITETMRRRTGRTIDLTSSAPAAVTVRPDMVSRALQNVLSNAHKFSPASMPINVSVNRAVVTVTDAGPGISEEDRAKVFDRFYRATESRSKPGSGLGLSIVRQIAEAHDSTVRIADAPGGGAAVIFDLTACT